MKIKIEGSMYLFFVEFLVGINHFIINLATAFVRLSYFSIIIKVNRHRLSCIFIIMLIK